MANARRRTSGVHRKVSAAEVSSTSRNSRIGSPAGAKFVGGTANQPRGYGSASGPGGGVLGALIGVRITSIGGGGMFREGSPVRGGRCGHGLRLSQSCGPRGGTA